MMKTITINDLEIRNLEQDDCIIVYSNDGIKKTPESTERVLEKSGVEVKEVDANGKDK